MSARYSTTWGSRCAPGITAPGRCTVRSARSRVPGRRSTSTTPRTRSMRSPTASARRRSSSRDPGGTRGHAWSVQGGVMQLQSMYQEIILDHYRNPKNNGLREPYDALGCSISQASASMMTEMIIGKTVREAMDLSGEFLALMQSRGEGEPDEDMLGDAVAFEGVSRYPARIKCALLGWMAWKDATAQALDGP